MDMNWVRDMIMPVEGEARCNHSEFLVRGMAIEIALDNVDVFELRNFPDAMEELDESLRRHEITSVAITHVGVDLMSGIARLCELGWKIDGMQKIENREGEVKLVDALIISR